jgi:hypothetical protein
MIVFGIPVSMLDVSVMQDIEDHPVSFKNVHLARTLSMGMVTRQVVIALDEVYVIMREAYVRVLQGSLEHGVRL